MDFEDFLDNQPTVKTVTKVTEMKPVELMKMSPPNGMSNRLKFILAGKFCRNYALVYIDPYTESMERFSRTYFNNKRTVRMSVPNGTLPFLLNKFA